MNIGQAAIASGINAKLIRYYESIGLIAPAARTASGYRVYGSDDVHVLRFIRRARKLGFSIEQIATLVGLWRDRDRASSEVKALAQTHLDELEARILELTAMRDSLAALVSSCHGDDRPDCPILGDLASLDDCRTVGQEPSDNQCNSGRKADCGSAALRKGASQ